MILTAQSVNTSHEQEMRPGLTTTLLAPRARALLIAAFIVAPVAAPTPLEASKHWLVRTNAVIHDDNRHVLQIQRWTGPAEVTQPPRSLLRIAHNIGHCCDFKLPARDAAISSGY